MGKKFRTVLKAAAFITAAVVLGPTTLIGRVLFAAGVSKLANVAITALGFGPKRPAPPPINVTVRGTVEFRRIVFGRRRCGGVLLFYGVSGSQNQYLWYVIGYAGLRAADCEDLWHPCDGSPAQISEAQVSSVHSVSVPACSHSSPTAPSSSTTPMPRSTNGIWPRFATAIA